MAYQRGDVLLVPFPFSDLSTSKVRPAVVVSSALYHTSEPDLLLAALAAHDGLVDVEARKQVIRVVVRELGRIGGHRARRRRIVARIDALERFRPGEAAPNRSLILGALAGHEPSRQRPLGRGAIK